MIAHPSDHPPAIAATEHDPEEQRELDAATDADTWLDELREVFR